METLKVASLFCGCGGTDVGLIGNFDFLGRHYDDNGMEIVYANDIDDNACAIFEKNFGITPDKRDIRTVSSDELPEFDILTGGFPCQSFSIVAQNPPRLGIKDDRGMLFFEMCRILRERQPKCFIAENVKGILTANKKAAFPLIIKEFENSGYDVKYTVLNAAEYGVPQKRERVIIVGFRKDLNIDFSFPEPVINNEEEYEPLQSVIDDEVAEKYFFSEKAVAGMLRNRDSMNKGRAQDITKPCNTVGAHLAKVSLNSTDPVLFVDGRYRRFTPREVARIQSFPENFQLIGTESAQYRALGNAIPPVMFWYVAKKVSDILKPHSSPCSQTAERVATSLDEAIISENIEALKENINEALDVVENENGLSKSIVYYCLGTAYGELNKLQGTKDEGLVKKQIYFLRKSISILESVDCDTPEILLYLETYQTNAYVNYGNVLCECGRVIAAINQYKKAIELQPRFGMALGNLGKAYKDYSILESDTRNQEYFHHFAYAYLKQASECTDPNTYPEAKKFFDEQADQFNPTYVESFLSKDLNIPQINIRGKKEYAYRKWAVENNLFLNTQNDLPPTELCFACDSLQLPEMTAPIEDKPVFHGMFNQIKQEYVFARYQYYLSLQELSKPHFADKGTHLINFADYPQYGMRIEQVKSAFKTLFGLLDKMAYFLNSYFDLGIAERDVSFYSIWNSEHGKGKHHYKYKNMLDYNDNFALSSLYWISRDLYDSFEDSPYPQLERIKKVRHALEHKYVRITRGWFTERMNGDIDDLALYVTEGELYDLTLQLMHIVRETIICLTLCVHMEEQSRQKENEGKVVIPILLHEYDDDWKI